MDPSREPEATVGDRRAGERRSAAAPLRITLERPVFDGVCDNLSETGVFFTSTERLRVTVELEEGGRRRVLHGHLVRVQRMSADSTGYAIELDRDPPGPIPGAARGG